MSGTERPKDAGFEKLNIGGVEIAPPGWGVVVGLPSVAAVAAYIAVDSFWGSGLAVTAAVVVGLGTLAACWMGRVVVTSLARRGMYRDTVIVRTGKPAPKQ
jgi:glutamyl-tRNA reductase